MRRELTNKEREEMYDSLFRSQDLNVMHLKLSLPKLAFTELCKRRIAAGEMTQKERDEEFKEMNENICKTHVDLTNHGEEWKIGGSSRRIVFSYLNNGNIPDSAPQIFLLNYYFYMLFSLLNPKTREETQKEIDMLTQKVNEEMDITILTKRNWSRNADNAIAFCTKQYSNLCNSFTEMSNQNLLEKIVLNAQIKSQAEENEKLKSEIEDLRKGFVNIRTKEDEDKLEELTGKVGLLLDENYKLIQNSEVTQKYAERMDLLNQKLTSQNETLRISNSRCISQTKEAENELAKIKIERDLFAVENIKLESEVQTLNFVNTNLQKQIDELMKHNNKLAYEVEECEQKEKNIRNIIARAVEIASAQVRKEAYVDFADMKEKHDSLVLGLGHSAQQKSELILAFEKQIEGLKNDKKYLEEKLHLLTNKIMAEAKKSFIKKMNDEDDDSSIGGIGYSNKTQAYFKQKIDMLESTISSTAKKLAEQGKMLRDLKEFVVTEDVVRQFRHDKDALNESLKICLDLAKEIRAAPGMYLNFSTSQQIRSDTSMDLILKERAKIQQITRYDENELSFKFNEVIRRNEERFRNMMDKEILQHAELMRKDREIVTEKLVKMNSALKEVHGLRRTFQENIALQHAHNHNIKLENEELKEKKLNKTLAKLNNTIKPDYKIEVKQPTRTGLLNVKDATKIREYFTNHSKDYLCQAFLTKDYLNINGAKYDTRMQNDEWELQKSINSYKYSRLYKFASV